VVLPKRRRLRLTASHSIFRCAALAVTCAFPFGLNRCANDVIGIPIRTLRDQGCAGVRSRYPWPVPSPSGISIVTVWLVDRVAMSRIALQPGPGNWEAACNV
jgi:hypothetical protein